MEEEILKKIEEQQVKIDATYQSVEKLRKYFFWTMVITLATIIIPIVLAIIILPYVLGSISSIYGGLQ